MNTNQFQASGFFKECLRKHSDTGLHRIFKANMYEPVDTDGISGADHISAIADRIINYNEPPEEIVMRDMGRFLESLQAILNRHANAGLSHEDIEYASLSLENLTTLYHELLQCGVKTIPFDPPEIVCARYIEHLQHYKAFFEALSDEKFLSSCITTLFQVKMCFLLGNQPVTVKIRISGQVSPAGGTVKSHRQVGQFVKMRLFYSLFFEGVLSL